MDWTVLAASFLFFVNLSFISNTANAFPSPAQHQQQQQHLLDDLLVTAGLDPSLSRVETLMGPGLCNELYQVDDRYVAKVFSGMASRRRRFVQMERVAGESNIGPRVIATTPSSVLMEKLVGFTTLNEAMIHGPAVKGRVLIAIAQKLRELHHTPLPEDDQTNMLWYSMEAMLEIVQSDELEREYMVQKGKVESADLPLICGHGDFKPSNILFNPRYSSSDDDGQEVVFIDFEISGPNYRSFDAAKLFRTASPTQHSKTNREDFLRYYSGGEDWKDLDVETKLLYPLTWLEAAVFFAYAAKLDHENASQWLRLQEDRMSSYKSCV